jgi:hypothetical protein
MTTGSAKKLNDYLMALPEDRRKAISTLRDVVVKNLPEGFVESVGGKFIVYEIPLERYPVTYNKLPLSLAAITSNKNNMTIYLMSVYSDEKTTKWFHEKYKASGKKLDMGKSCVHIKKLDDLPLDVIAETIRSCSVDEYIRRYEAGRKKAKSK